MCALICSLPPDRHSIYYWRYFYFYLEKQTPNQTVPPISEDNHSVAQSCEVIFLLFLRLYSLTRCNVSFFL